MKVRHPILWFCAVIVAIMSLLILFSKRRSDPISLTLTDSNAGRHSINGSGTKAGDAQIESSFPPNSNIRKAVPDEHLENKGQEIRDGLAALNDVPVIFYGKLQDQFGNPVANAEITGSIIIRNGVTSGTKKVNTTSDTSGLFQLNGGKGESLGIMPHKEGYALATNGTEFKYSYMYNDHFTPDSNNPVIIQMWKLQGAEALADISKEYRLSFTNMPICFDLIARTVVPTGGDLKVTIIRAPGSLSKKNPADWSIELEPINGGISETDYHIAQVTFEAPDDGYKDTYLVQMRKDDPGWYDNVHQFFFLRSRGGQVHAKFNLDFGINREPNDRLYFQFRGVANTNGSRNWEATAPKAVQTQ